MTKRLTFEQLQQFRSHADQYPVGDTATLLAHIDWQRERFKNIALLLESLSTYSRADEFWLYEIKRMLEEGGE